MAKPEGERLQALETNMSNIERRLSGIETTINSVEVKLDSYVKLLSENYMTKEAHDLDVKNQNLQKLIWFIVGAVITGLIAFFLRELRF